MQQRIDQSEASIEDIDQSEASIEEIDQSEASIEEIDQWEADNSLSSDVELIIRRWLGNILF